MPISAKEEKLQLLSKAGFVWDRLGRNVWLKDLGDGVITQINVSEFERNEPHQIAELIKLRTKMGYETMRRDKWG